MKILLDECLPKKLSNLLVGHETKTTQQCGWSGLLNGELLKVAQEEFDILLTVDKNLPNQQSLEKYSIGVLVMITQSNDIQVLREFVPNILSVLNEGKFTKEKFVKV